MNKQEILEQLSGIECALYYMADGSDDPQGLTPDQIETAHDKAKELLEYWHKITGCTL